jgi:hypothetical protein
MSALSEVGIRVRYLSRPTIVVWGEPRYSAIWWALPVEPRCLAAVIFWSGAEGGSGSRKEGGDFGDLAVVILNLSITNA